MSTWKLVAAVAMTAVMIRACQKTTLSPFVFLQALMAGPNTCDVNVIH